MKKEENIEKKVAETLTSIDHTKRATANPFLFTRIMARLKEDQKSFWMRSLDFLNRPAIAIAAVLLILLMNSFAFFQPTEAVTVQEDDQLFATEYNLVSSTADGFYQVNDEQP